MKQTVKAILDKHARRCPHCHDRTIMEIEQGISVDRRRADLVTCYDCNKIFIVFLDSAAGAFPIDVETEISEAVLEKAAYWRQAWNESVAENVATI